MANKITQLAPAGTVTPATDLLWLEQGGLARKITVASLGIPAVGTVTSAMLRWNGTAWVEETQALLTSGGAITAVSFGGIAQANLISSIAAKTITGAFTFQTLAGTPSMQYGLNGDYNSTGGANTWGATVWAIDDTWQGGVAAVDSLAGNNYGIRYLRVAHTEAHSQVGEGLYGYVNGTMTWGAGDGGIATFNGDRLSAYSVGNDKVIQMRHDDTDGVIAAASSGAIRFITANKYTFDDGLLALQAFSVSGGVADDGQIGIFGFMDVASGICRFGGYNYDTPGWQPVELHGSAIEINSQTGPSIKLQAAGVDIVDINSSGNIDVFGYDLRIRDAGKLFLFDTADAKSLELSHDGTQALITTGAGDGAIFVQHEGTTCIQTLLYSTLGNTSAINLRNHAGNFLNAGFNVLPDFGWNVTPETLEAGHCGAITGYNYVGSEATADLVLTLAASGDLDFPVDGVVNIINGDDTWNVQIVEGTGVTLYVLVAGSGFVDSTGSADIGPGGMATLRRESSTVYHLMGSEITYP